MGLGGCGCDFRLVDHIFKSKLDQQSISPENKRRLQLNRFLPGGKSREDIIKISRAIRFISGIHAKSQSHITDFSNIWCLRGPLVSSEIFIYKSWPELQDDLTLLFFSPGTWGGLPKYIYGAMGKCILLFAKSWQKYQNHLLHDHSQPLVLHTVRTNLFGNKHHQLIDAHGLFRHLHQSHKATPKPFSRYARRQFARSPNNYMHRVFYIFFC